MSETVEDKIARVLRHAEMVDAARAVREAEQRAHWESMSSDERLEQLKEQRKVFDNYVKLSEALAQDLKIGHAVAQREWSGND